MGAALIYLGIFYGGLASVFLLNEAATRLTPGYKDFSYNCKSDDAIKDYSELLKEAEKEIDIVTGLQDRFYCNDSVIGALEGALSEDIKVNIVIDSENEINDKLKTLMDKHEKLNFYRLPKPIEHDFMIVDNKHLRYGGEGEKDVIAMILHNTDKDEKFAKLTQDYKDFFDYLVSKSELT